MSSKFSQGASTQTKPAVCHTWPYPPVPFGPPDYPPLKAYCQFTLKNNAGNLVSGQFTTMLKWYHPPDFWQNRWPPPNHPAIITIRPFPPPQLVRVSIAIVPPASPAYVHDWYPDPYTPGKPWWSGENLGQGADPANQIWSTFATTP